MTDVVEIVNAVLRGQLESVAISHWSRLFWESGSFIHHVDPSQLDVVPDKGETLGRYGRSSEIGHHVLYGEEGKAGCVVVSAPHDEAYTGDFTDLLVPPHTHASDHITVVLGGGGTTVIQRTIDGQPTILLEPARPGTVVFYPAGIPHTFIVGDEGIRVASTKSEFESPLDPHFAEYDAESANKLPRISYADYRAAGV